MNGDEIVNAGINRLTKKLRRVIDSEKKRMTRRHIRYCLMIVLREVEEGPIGRGYTTGPDDKKPE